MQENGAFFKIFDHGDGTCAVYLAEGETPEALEFPSEIDGLAVVEIGEDACADRENLRTVTIPRGVKVIGDGAFTGGMVHEALNNVEKNLRLVIVLNENEMSIAKNTGRIANTLAHIRRGKAYFNAKKVTRNVLNSIPLVGKHLFRVVKRAKMGVKNALYGSNYFEGRWY